MPVNWQRLKLSVELQILTWSKEIGSNFESSELLLSLKDNFDKVFIIYIDNKANVLFSQIQTHS